MNLHGITIKEIQEEISNLISEDYTEDEIYNNVVCVSDVKDICNDEEVNTAFRYCVGSYYLNNVDTDYTKVTNNLVFEDALLWINNKYTDDMTHWLINDIGTKDDILRQSLGEYIVDYSMSDDENNALCFSIRGIQFVARFI